MDATKRCVNRPSTFVPTISIIVEPIFHLPNWSVGGEDNYSENSMKCPEE
jgi:hypothetical protein